MDKDILDQYIYAFPFVLPNSSKDSCTLICSISFQSYFKEIGSLCGDTIKDALKGFSDLSIIGHIAMFYEKDNDFIHKITIKLFPYASED